MTIPNKEIRRANRLIKEKSPYLLQHAYNPVDLFAWSNEAFEKAQSEDKPVFLSIGYSTCHWCQFHKIRQLNRAYYMSLPFIYQTNNQYMPV